MPTSALSSPTSLRIDSGAKRLTAENALLSRVMRALATAVLYFGTFLMLGYGAKRLLDRWIDRHGADLDDVQKQAGDGGRKGGSFLLGVWRK